MRVEAVGKWESTLLRLPFFHNDDICDPGIQDPAYEKGGGQQTGQGQILKGEQQRKQAHSG